MVQTLASFDLPVEAQGRVQEDRSEPSERSQKLEVFLTERPAGLLILEIDAAGQIVFEARRVRRPGYGKRRGSSPRKDNHNRPLGGGRWFEAG